VKEDYGQREKIGPSDCTIEKVRGQHVRAWWAMGGKQEEQKKSEGSLLRSEEEKRRGNRPG